MTTTTETEPMNASEKALETFDPRPYTAVLHQYVGMGDLVWHLPYFRAVAATSRDGQVSVIASPTTFARELLVGESCVREVIAFDRRPRRSEKRQGGHAGIPGLFKIARELRVMRFDRIVIFSGHANRGFLAWLAGIPTRIGFGTNWMQRRLLSGGPYIRLYRGASVPVYKDATALAIAHGFCTAPVAPRLTLPEADVEAQRALLATLPRPMYTFAIGSSEIYKQWGAMKFAGLATALARRGCSVVLLGGPGEADMARDILAGIAPPLRRNVVIATSNTIVQSAATLQLADANIGNDTGISNLAAALGRRSYVVLGNRPLLDHDPLMRMLLAPSPLFPGDRRNHALRKSIPVHLEMITVADVLARLESEESPGFEASPSATLTGVSGVGEQRSGAIGTYIDCSDMRLGDRMACAWWAQRRRQRTGQRFGLLDRNRLLREAFDLSEFFPETFQAVTADEVASRPLDQWHQGPLWLTARNEFARCALPGHFESVPDDIVQEAHRLRQTAGDARPRVLLHVLDDAAYNRRRNWNIADTQALIGQLKAEGVNLVVLNPTRGQFIGGYRRLLAEMLASDAFIGGDTGPSHVWSLLCPDKPQIAIHPEDSRDAQRWSIVQRALGLPLPWSSLPLRSPLPVVRMKTAPGLKLEFGKFGVRRVHDSRFSAAEVVASLKAALRGVAAAPAVMSVVA